MPKKLFDGSLVTTLDNLDRVSLGQPGVPSSKNVVWSKFKDLIIGDTVPLAASLSPAVKDTHYLVDASGGEVPVELPAVVAGNKDRFIFTLTENNHHCNITVVGGQLIGGLSVLSLATKNAQVVVKGNGVDGYDVLSDEREYYRIVEFSTNLDLTNGIESGALYLGSPPDGQEIVVTMQNWSIDHAGDFAKFTKVSGVNSSIRVVSQDTSFDEVILTDNKGFELAYGGTTYRIVQDSRPTSALVTLDFYPTSALSTIEGTYNNLVNNTSDPDFDDPAVIFSTPPITSEVETSVGFFINDSKALNGLISERGVSAVAQVKLQTSGNRLAFLRFRYYQYDVSGMSLGPIISETAFSEGLAVTSFVQKFVGGLLPTLDWAGKTLVIELMAKKDAVGGDNPIIDFNFGGSTPSKTSIDLPATGISHDTLAGISTAGPGVNHGHINNKYPLQIPQLTTAERDAISPAYEGMIIENTTTAQQERYDGATWVGVGGGGAAERENTTTVVAADSLTTTVDFSAVEVETLDIDDGVTDHTIAVSNLSTTERYNTLVIDNSANTVGLTVTFNDQTGAITYRNAKNEFPGVYPTMNIAADAIWEVSFENRSAALTVVSFDEMEDN